MDSSLYYTAPAEQNSVAAKLIDLFTLPSRVFTIHVGEGRDILVKIRLLNDKENQEVADITDKYGPFGKVLAQRRQILVRAVESIEGSSVEMPEALKQEYLDRLGRKPTPVEEKLWVFELCQSTVLTALFECYDELQEEQRARVTELKKKSTEPSVDQSPEMKPS